MVLVDRSGALDSTCMVHGMPVAQEIKKIKRNCDEDDVEERVKAMKSQNPRKQNRVRSCVIGESQQFSPKNRNSTPFRVSPLPLSSFTSHHLFPHSSFLASASPFIHLVSYPSPFFLRNPFIVIQLIQFIPWRSPSKRSPLCARLAADPRPSLVSRRECPSETKALCRAFDCGGPCSLGRVAPSHRQ